MIRWEAMVGNRELARTLAVALATGDVRGVGAAIAAGAAADALDVRGLAPLHLAAGWAPTLDATRALLALHRGVVPLPLAAFPAHDDDPDAPAALLVEELLGRGAAVDVRAQPSGLTPLHVATALGRRAVARLLIARGADEAARDAHGRTPAMLAALPTLGRAVRTCRAQPSVRAAYVAQVVAPHTEQRTSPVIALDLAGPLPGDAFAGWPADAPIVVTALGADAVSRLIALAPPAYVATSTPDAPPVARAIADALGGEVRALAGDEPYAQHAIVLADGDVPVLVRDHAIAVPGIRAWPLAPGGAVDAIVAEVAAAVRARAIPDAPWLELALALHAELEAATGARWTFAIPGPPDPTELWLRGPIARAAAFGVFSDGRVATWRRDVGLEVVAVASRAAIAGILATVDASLAEQLAAYAEHRALATRLRTRAVALASALGIEVMETGEASYAQVPRFALVRGGRACATFEPDALAIGAVQIPLAADDAAVVAAARAALALPEVVLRAGGRYRVIAEVGELRVGAVVTYRYYDDVDNHFGRHVFVDDNGAECVVAGDFARGDDDVLRALEPAP